MQCSHTQAGWSRQKGAASYTSLREKKSRCNFIFFPVQRIWQQHLNRDNRVGKKRHLNQDEVLLLLLHVNYIKAYFYTSSCSKYKIGATKVNRSKAYSASN